MENLLTLFPPILVDKFTDKHAWFTLGAADDNWMAAYLDENGDVVNNLFAFGDTPLLALQHLFEHLQFLEMFARPALHAPEDDRIDN